jgi:endonuclease-3
MHDITSNTGNPILKAMLADWQSKPVVRLEKVMFASDPEANRLVKENLIAFLMAASIDRGGKSFQIFNVPYKFQQKWGHLDTRIIRQMDAAELAIDPILVSVPSTMSRRQLARSIISVASVIEDEYDGDPERIIEGSINDVQSNLMQIYGIGPGIARMIIIQRLLYFGFEPQPGGMLLPKQDTHINRVFARTNLITEPVEAQIRNAVRGYSNRDIAIIDQVAWTIGKNYCFPTQPNCPDCPLEAVCPKNLRVA